MAPGPGLRVLGFRREGREHGGQRRVGDSEWTEFGVELDGIDPAARDGPVAMVGLRINVADRARFKGETFSPRRCFHPVDEFGGIGKHHCVFLKTSSRRGQETRQMSGTDFPYITTPVESAERSARSARYG